MNTLLQDIRFGLRSLGKSPVFTAVAVLSLALGIGANTAIFTLLDQVLLRALPVSDPPTLVNFASPGGNYGAVRGGPECFSYPMYKDLRDKTEAFSGLAAFYGTDMSLSFGEQTQRADGELVTATTSTSSVSNPPLAA